MPLTPAAVFMTARGLLVDPHTACYIYATPRVPCQRIPAILIDRSPDAASYEYSCCGLAPGGPMSPADNVPWDGLPCSSPTERPGCCQCSCGEYTQHWYLAAGDAVVLPGARAVTVEFVWPCALGAELADYSVVVMDTGAADYNGDGDLGTDQDIEDFFACLQGDCCLRCTRDYDADGSPGTDQDIEAFFRTLGGG